MVQVIRKEGPGAEKLKFLLNELSGNKVGKVGWFPSAKYPDGTPVAYVAAIQEFGYAAGGIPPRPFMRTTIAEKQGEWRELVASGASGILAGNYTVSQVLDGVGQQAAGDIAKTISQIYDPPLKPSTVRARMRQKADKKTVGNLTKPLVHTGLLISTIQNTVEEA